MQADTERLVDRAPPVKEKKLSLKPRDALLAGGATLLIGGGAWFALHGSDKSALMPDISEMKASTHTSVDADASDADAQAPKPLITDGELAPVERPPALDGSDAQVVAALQEMSPPLLKWFTPDEQIRKWVLLTVNLSEGDLVTKHRPVKYRMDTFKTRTQGGKTYMNPANYGRANNLINAVLAIPPEKLAAYYRQWSPVLTHSFVELGLDGTFHGHFMRVLDKTIEAQPLASSPSLSRPNVLYTYADPKLEEASDLEKLLWRLGPEHMTEVQAYAKSLKDAM